MIRPVIVAMLLLFSFVFINTASAQLSRRQEDRLKELERKEDLLEEWKNKNLKESAEFPEDAENIQERQDKIEKKPPRPDISEFENGRFQAIRLDNNAVFLLDTKEGHLWVWVIQKDSKGIPSEFLFYQGMLVPGKNMGDLIDRTYKKLSQEKQ